MNIPIAIASVCNDCDNIVVAERGICPSCASSEALQPLADLVPTLGPVESRYSPATVKDASPFTCVRCGEGQPWGSLGLTGICRSCYRKICAPRQSRRLQA